MRAHSWSVKMVVDGERTQEWQIYLDERVGQICEEAVSI